MTGCGHLVEPRATDAGLVCGNVCRVDHVCHAVEHGKVIRDRCAVAEDGKRDAREGSHTMIMPDSRFPKHKPAAIYLAVNASII